MTDRLEDSYNVVVIGGGAAGLNGAMMLARSRRRVAVIDAGAPRNARAEGVHGLLGHDGLPPAELLERGRAEVRRYGGDVVTGEVTGAARDDLGFTVTLADGSSTRGRRLLVTTGLVDVLPDVPGVRERWGRDVLHCPYCHGWEVRDRAIGILASSPMSMHQALLFRQLTDDVTFFARDLQLDDEQAEQLVARGIRVVEGAVASVDVVDDRIAGVRMSDGSVVDCEAVVVAPRMVARAGFLQDLGLHVAEHQSGMGEHVPCDPAGRTDVPGVWVAGNVTDLSAQVGAAASQGALAGAQINADLVMEETDRAVETRRSAARHHHPEHAADPAAFWEEFYGGDRRPWSGRPNPALVGELHDRPAPVGRVLDLGCGAGADAIWLAEQGWDVTGLDISATALEQAAVAARAAGVADRVTLVRHDLADGLAAGAWDLVVAAYLHSPVVFEREKVLRLAATAVAPGGTLIVIGHQGHPSWHDDAPAHVTFPSADEVLASLDVQGWTVEQAGPVHVALSSPEGVPGSRIDNVLRLLRDGAQPPR
ncbi:MAG TPA: FAD-dependent oxidoreductase [Nocardioides sp.]|nr:FAD-dependent oxidoreductase [Nocardioides sp.]